MSTPMVGSSSLLFPAHEPSARTAVRPLPFGWSLRAFGDGDPRRVYFAARYPSARDLEPPPCVCVSEAIASEVDAIVRDLTAGIPALNTLRGGRA